MPRTRSPAAPAEARGPRIDAQGGEDRSPPDPPGDARAAAARLVGRVVGPVPPSVSADRVVYALARQACGGANQPHGPPLAEQQDGLRAAQLACVLGRTHRRRQLAAVVCVQAPMGPRVLRDIHVPEHAKQDALSKNFWPVA
jgi:hypothetical protein